ncbi:fungal-specific transcription factor domain-containing protein [Aspergillus venezuelensis]
MAAQDKFPKAPRRSTTACTECQRRKQKCSRTWPCNHCQGRKIPHLCKFSSRKAVKAVKSEAKTTRALNDLKPSLIPEDLIDSRNGTTHDDDLRSLGYLPDIPDISNDGARGLESSNSTPQLNQISLSIEMYNALQTIPPKHYTDILIGHFLDHTNYHYYSLYPPAFRQDYVAWWSAKESGLPLTPEFTCLLLRVCACSAPYLDEDIRRTLEIELGSDIEQLSFLYHRTAKQLSDTIKPGKDFVQVQQLFLTAQWFKTEALFVESWHALGVAIHEAQEQGMHKSSSGSKFSDFDREMRRRLWSILYVWDWQMSLLLSRPFIINSSCCAFETPDLRLESPDSEPEIPSPITHMVLQCQLGLLISKSPSVASGTISSTEAMTIQQETEKWFASFSSAYSLTDTDTRWDSIHPFVKLQRFQLHVIGYMVMLMPLKQCLTKQIAADSTGIEKALQATAIETALKLLISCDELLKHILPINAKFHFAPFLMFDTSALLCSAITHDINGTLAQHDRVLGAIQHTVTELSRLSERAKTGMICYTALKKLSSCLPLGVLEAPSVDLLPAQSSTKERSALSNIPESPNPLSELAAPELSDDFLENELALPTTFDFLPPDPPNNNNALADLYEIDLGELSQIWDWSNLEFDFPAELSIPS